MSEVEENRDATAAESAPGNDLRIAREAAELTQENIAADLKITKRYVQALESNDYDALPSKLFVVGYLKAYARLLSLSVDEVIDAYNEYVAVSCGGVTEKVKSKNEKRTDSLAELESPSASTVKKPAKKIWVGCLAAVVVVFSTVLAFQDDADSTVITEASTLGQTAPELVVGADEQGDSLTAESPIQGEVEEQAAATVAESDAVISADNNVEDSTVSLEQDLPAESEVAALDTISFDFSRTCWLEVTDAQGDVLDTDLYQSGATKTLQGHAPFEVLLGNVNAVDLALNDKALELPSTPDGQRTRLRVDAAGDVIILAENTSP